MGQDSLKVIIAGRGSLLILYHIISITQWGPRGDYNQRVSWMSDAACLKIKNKY